MMKYSGLSDFEVNRLVAFRLKIECSFQHNQVVVSDGVFGRAIDYCNNWGDAGPLMTENCISLQFRDSAGLNPMAVCDNFYAVNANPCRAIAECYLMMTEGE